MDEDVRRLMMLISGEIIRIEARTAELAKIADAALIQARASMIEAQASMVEAKASTRKAEASWELVIMTRNDMKRPWWKKA